jgi:hypothetical protein
MERKGRYINLIPGLRESISCKIVPYPNFEKILEDIAKNPKNLKISIVYSRENKGSLYVIHSMR